ncbi:MAG: hypothetical protein IJW29_04000 [Clostridia bacterium]|nr:hypothetical protein [Clostridia bacterium]
MDATKIFTVLCACLLLICLILTVTSLLIMQKTLERGAAFQEQAAATVGAFLQGWRCPHQSEHEEAPPADVEADVLYNRFTLKETGGKIGVYSDEGYLIRTFDIDVSTLPPEAREGLRVGVTFHSWRELIALIEDYES